MMPFKLPCMSRYRTFHLLEIECDKRAYFLWVCDRLLLPRAITIREDYGGGISVLGQEQRSPTFPVKYHVKDKIRVVLLVF